MRLDRSRVMRLVRKSAYFFFLLRFFPFLCRFFFRILILQVLFQLTFAMMPPCP